MKGACLSVCLLTGWGLVVYTALGLPDRTEVLQKECLSSHSASSPWLYTIHLFIYSLIQPPQQEWGGEPTATNQHLDSVWPLARGRKLSADWLPSFIKYFAICRWLWFSLSDVSKVPPVFTCLCFTSHLQPLCCELRPCLSLNYTDLWTQQCGEIRVFCWPKLRYKSWKTRVDIFCCIFGNTQQAMLDTEAMQQHQIHCLSGEIRYVCKLLMFPDLLFTASDIPAVLVGYLYLHFLHCLNSCMERLQEVHKSAFSNWSWKQSGKTQSESSWKQLSFSLCVWAAYTLIQTMCCGVVYSAWEREHMCAGACEWEKKSERETERVKHRKKTHLFIVSTLSIKHLGNTDLINSRLFSAGSVWAVEVNSPRPAGVRTAGLKHSWTFSQANLGGPVCPPWLQWK